MSFSNKFLSLVDEQLASFDSDAELEALVVYVAKTNKGGSPTLEVIGQRPKQLRKVLGPIENDPDLRIPSSNRRWYPLQDGSILLGVLRIERFPSDEKWPEPLDQRLQLSASLLANYLSLELNREKLLNELSEQRDQIGILVHQLRNPLTALRTYAQLLLKKLDPESNQRILVESLISEQKQVDKYLIALDAIAEPKLLPKAITPARLLLPPWMPSKTSVDLMQLLNPLIDRAQATAKLQGFKWQGPDEVPSWMKKPRPAAEGFIAEIVANLLENAFRYSPEGASVGISFSYKAICVWDSGKPIPFSQRKKIFETGFRSEKSKTFLGSGLGLSLARELAKQFGGELKLIVEPSNFEKSLPKEGNAFIIDFPEE